MFAEISEELVKVEAKSHFWLSRKSCHTTGFKTSCWFVEMRTLLSVPASVSPLAWSLASQWNVSLHSKYFIFHLLFFFFFLAWGVPRTALFLSSQDTVLLPSNRQRQSYLIDKILLDKILLKCHLPMEFNPNILLTLEPWHFDVNQHKCHGRLALMTLWALPM